MRRTLVAMTGVVLTLLAAAQPAAAAPDPVNVVHSETVPMGAATLTVSFDDWPVPSHRSMDFLFEPVGGIEGRTGLLRVVSPSGEVGISGIGLERRGDDIVLPRHPRARDVWGLDVVALPEEGTWRFEFTVDGPQGRSTGVLPVEAGPAPGPPMTLSWVVAMLPWVIAVPLLAYAGIRRIRRGTGKPTWR